MSGAVRCVKTDCAQAYVERRRRSGPGLERVVHEQVVGGETAGQAGARQLDLEARADERGVAVDPVVAAGLEVARRSGRRRAGSRSRRRAACRCGRSDPAARRKSSCRRAHLVPEAADLVAVRCPSAPVRRLYATARSAPGTGSTWSARRAQAGVELSASRGRGTGGSGRAPLTEGAPATAARRRRPPPRGDTSIPPPRRRTRPPWRRGRRPPPARPRASTRRA